MKKFITYFFIVLLAEIALWVLILLVQSYNTPAFLKSAAIWIKVLLSLPLSLIHRSYPYWAEGGFVFTLLLVFATLFLHTLFVYFLFKSIRNKKTIHHNKQG